VDLTSGDPIQASEVSRRRTIDVTPTNTEGDLNTASDVATYVESIAHGLQSNPQHTDAVLAIAQRLSDSASLADVCCALGSLKRTSDEVINVASDKRLGAIKGLLTRATRLTKYLPQWESALASSGRDQARVSLPPAMTKKLREVKHLLRHAEALEQQMVHEGCAIRRRMRDQGPQQQSAADDRVANMVALAQLKLFLPLSLTAPAVMNTIARLDQAPADDCDLSAPRDVMLLDEQPTLGRRITDIRLWGWGTVAAGSLLLNASVPPEFVLGLCGMGSLLVFGASVKQRAVAEITDQIKLAASTASHTEADGRMAQEASNAPLQKLARFVASEYDQISEAQLANHSDQSEHADLAESPEDAIVMPGVGNEFRIPGALMDICGLFEHARDLAYWLIELEAGVVSPKAFAFAEALAAVADNGAEQVEQVLKGLIEDLTTEAGTLNRADAFHLKTAMHWFQPVIGFTHGRQELMRAYDVGLNRINKLLADDLDRPKYDGVPATDDGAVAQWSQRECEDMQLALAEGRVRLNSAVLPTAREELKAELSSHIFAALRQRGARTKRNLLERLVGRVVAASGSCYETTLREDLLARLSDKPGFEPGQLIKTGNTHIYWMIRGSRFVVTQTQSYQWQGDEESSDVQEFSCERDVIFDIQSARFDGELFHVSTELKR
jgi:hypothetical protein